MGSKAAWLCSQRGGARDAGVGLDGLRSGEIASQLKLD